MQCRTGCNPVVVGALSRYIMAMRYPFQFVLVFAVLCGCQPEIEDLTDPVTVDGVSYGVVQIGEQVWFTENLQTTVYANGDSIPTGLTGLFANSEWATTTEGAVAVYGDGNYSLCEEYSPAIDACDEEQSLEAYGRLYNWYAVMDSRGLCPSGWHVPTDEDWTQLEDHVEAHVFEGQEGRALKTISGWMLGQNGTDDFGFAAPPGGYRGSDYGNFDMAGAGGNWWSSSADGEDAICRFLYTTPPGLNRNQAHPRKGYSVRCLRDAE